MFSEQAQFEKETLERLYGFVDSNYTLYDTYGRNAKPDIMSILILSKHVIGNSNADYSTLSSLIEKYCNCDSTNEQAFQTEKELLKAIVETQDEYVSDSTKQLETLKDKSKRIFSDIADEDKRDIDVRKNDLKYIIRQMTASSLLDSMACYKMYFDGLMYGLLPAEALPEPGKSSNAEFAAKEVPLFTHEPIYTDVPHDKTGSFFDGLRNLAETNALHIKGMFRDCNNGNVYVKLYDPNNDFAPEYIEVDKADAYNQWIINDGGYCNWPGYIISALQAKGVSIDSDPKDLLGRILGSKIVETNLAELCTFSESKIVIPEETTEFKIKSAYRDCGLAIYANLLVTNSNMIEDTKQYLALLDSIQEFTACFALSAADKQIRDAAINLLKQHSDKFRTQATLGELRTQKRILVCDAIDTMFEIYSTQPDVNPLEIIRAKYPQLKL